MSATAVAKEFAIKSGVWTREACGFLAAASRILYPVQLDRVSVPCIVVVVLVFRQYTMQTVVCLEDSTASRVFQSFQQISGCGRCSYATVGLSFADDIFRDRRGTFALCLCFVICLVQIAGTQNLFRAQPSQLQEHHHVVGLVRLPAVRRGANIIEARGGREAVTSTGLATLVDSARRLERGQSLQTRYENVKICEGSHLDFRHFSCCQPCCD